MSLWPILLSGLQGYLHKEVKAKAETDERVRNMLAGIAGAEHGMADGGPMTPEDAQKLKEETGIDPTDPLTLGAYNLGAMCTRVVKRAGKVFDGEEE